MVEPVSAILAKPLVDSTRIDALRSILKPDPLLRMIEAFSAAIDDRTAETQAALANDQPLEATRLTHSLKGTSGNFGADRLGAIAGRMESLLNDGDPQAAVALLDDLLETARLTVSALAPVADELRRQSDGR